MSRFPSPDSRDDGVIRITPADAASPHVDDLLKRQASLRGEEGITASRRRTWYYRNWFVFMLVGMIGALVAWAIVEPHFNDLLYVQGKVDVSNLSRPFALKIPLGGGQFVDLSELGEMMQAFVTVDDQPIWIAAEAKPLDADDPDALFDPSTLVDGEEIGVYVHYLEFPRDRSLALGVLVDTTPHPRNAPSASLADLQKSNRLAERFLFPLIAAAIGLGIGAADGVVCRLWRRALLGGAVGLVVGFLGGFAADALANLVYGPLAMAATKQEGDVIGGFSTLGFLIQMSARALGWGMAGMFAGLGQGIALRSWRLLLYGFLGGAIGGLVGGLLFDPVHVFIVGIDAPSAHVSRLVGLAAVGAGVGVMIGVIELLARDAWLNMVKGPLAGKEFLIFKDLLYVGASPRSDIYLFNDDAVAQRHAIIRAAADHYEIEAVDQMWPVLVNGRPVPRARLRHGDQIAMGETVFSFHRRRTD